MGVVRVTPYIQLRSSDPPSIPSVNMKFIVSLVCLCVVGAAWAQYGYNMVHLGSPTDEMEEERIDLSSRVSDEMLQKCIDNNDQAALARARAAAPTGETCLVSFRQRLLAMLQRMDVNGREDLAEPCRILRTNIINCTESFYADTYPCYSEEDIRALNLTQDMAVNFLNYVCGPELRIYDLALMTSLDRLCLSLVGENAVMCFQAVIEEAQQEGDKMFRRMLQPATCRRIRDANSCAQTHLDFCTNAGFYTAVDVIKGSMNSFVEAMPECGNEILEETNDVEILQL